MIAYGMLYTIAVGVPVTLAAMALAAVLRRHGRAERLVWLVALATSLALPALALTRPLGAPGLPALEDAAVTAVGAAPEETGVIGLPAVVVIESESAALGLGTLPAALWLLASMVLAARWAVAARRLARASRAWVPGTVDGVPVWMTEELGPAVAGVVRPRVLVPPWLLTLPGSQRSLVLLHEQEHIRAGDPALIALARAARILAPWNPVVWILSSRLVRAVELDCDRRVLSRSVDVATYGRTLLTVSERRPGKLVAAAAFAETEAPLRSRILAMTTPSRTISILALASATVLGVVLLIGALEIPVPAVRIQLEIASPATAAEADAPAESGAPPATGTAGGEAGASTVALTPATTPFVVRLSVDEDGVLRERRIGPTQEPAAGATAQQTGTEERPRFTPYTVAPRILNLEEVRQAMRAAVPQALRDAGAGGTVRVYFFIDEDGTVRDRRIDQSSGHAALDQIALDVASVYRFSPALNRDRRTPVWVSFPIAFQIAQTPSPAAPTSLDASARDAPQDFCAEPRFTPYTQPPRILNAPEVRRAMIQAYPQALRDAGTGGTVRVFFCIDAGGSVGAIRLEQSSGHAELDEAALAVSDVYRFDPAMNRDQRVGVWVAFPITFQVAR